MTLLDYIYCGVLALLGLAFAVLLQLKAQRDKAKLANLILPTLKTYINDESVTIALSLITIVIGLFLIPVVVGWKPAYIPYVRPAFLPIGYMGSDILLKLFGVVNKRLNAAIDMKTNIADSTTGNLAAPTPALPPQKTDSSPKI
jgi:hypothetical protein